MSFSPDKQIRLEQIMPVILEELAKGKKVTFGPKGNSMRPMLRQGIDSVELSPLPDRKLKKYELPLYQRPNGTYVIHRVVKVGDTYTCIGDNQYRYEYGVQPQWLIAVVSGFYRKDRYISTDRLLYRLYCRLWHYTRRPRHFLLRAKNKLVRMLKRR